MEEVVEEEKENTDEVVSDGEPLLWAAEAKGPPNKVVVEVMGFDLKASPGS